MRLELYAIIAFATFILTFLFIWSRQILYRRLQNLLAGSKDNYRQERILLHHTKRCLHYLHKEAKSLRNAPELAENMLGRMKLLLPPKAMLSEKRASLHNMTQHLYKKHLAHHARQSSLSAGEYTATPALANNLNTLSSIKNRLNHLDMAAQEQDKKIQSLLRLAQNFAAVRRVKHFRTCIKVAKEFQDSNISILKAIRQTERQLSAVNRNFNAIKKQK